MKRNLRLLPLLALAFLTLFSCQKESLLSEKENIDNWDVRVNDDGILTFKNEEVFNNTVSELLNMESSELNNWEQQLNFTSYHSRLMAITEETESLDSEESVLQFAQKYSNFYYLDEHDVENKSLEEVLTSTLYTRLANEDGCYIVADKMYKVGERSILEANTGNKEIINLECTQVDDYCNEKVNKFMYLDEEGTKTEITNPYEVTTTEGNRRVTITFTTYYISYFVVFKVHIKGQKKVGAWFNYKTELSYKNVSAHIEYPIDSSNSDSETVTMSNYTSPSDEYSHEYTNAFRYSMYYHTFLYPLPTFEELDAEYTSRGIVSWGVVNL